MGLPSYQDCHQYLVREGLEYWQEEIQIIIDMHHLISSYQGPYQELTEVFRKADLVDFSLGLLKSGVEASFIKAVKKALPNEQFHRTLIRFSVIQLTRNPFKPLPMMRIRNIYKN